MAEDGKPSKAQRLVEGLSDRRTRHKERSRIYRIAVVGAGVVVLLAGLAMTVLPGPAVVVIPIGLSLLALEFVWAETVLEKVAKGADFALSRRPPKKAWVAAAAVLVATAATILIVNA
jgi:uncharacterized protein (TIGR02611 family)